MRHIWICPTSSTLDKYIYLTKSWKYIYQKERAYFYIVLGSQVFIPVSYYYGHDKKESSGTTRLVYPKFQLGTEVQGAH
jgi:hypothetical protein